MNYFDENFTTSRLITLHVSDVDEYGTDVLHTSPPMTQVEVAKFCETCPHPVDAYIDNQWIGSTEL